MKKIIPLILVVFFLVALLGINVNAYSLVWDFGIMTQQQNECFNIPSTCDNCTYMNITVLYPNGTIVVDNQAMTNLSSVYHYNYSFCETSVLGEYWVITNYDDDALYLNTDANFFDITLNGNERPEGIVKVLFFAFFLFILFWAILSFLRVLGHWKDLEVDIIEVATVLGLYFVIFAYQYLAINYLGDKLINDIMELMVVVGAITHVFIPLVAFAASLILNPFRRGNK